MFLKNFILFFGFSLISLSIFSQKDSLNIKGLRIEGDIKVETYNVLAPSKAAFYSALFPGGGQIYNRQYWKGPLVSGALAFPPYLYLYNNNEYKRYRRAFKLREAGLQAEFTIVEV